MTEILAPTRAYVSKGQPSDEELAALVAVLTALTAAPPPAKENLDRPIAGGWKSYWRSVRQPFVYGPEAWRGSLR